MQYTHNGVQSTILSFHVQHLVNTTELMDISALGTTSVVYMARKVVYGSHMARYRYV